MKTPRWKVRKLPDGRWLAHHPACPPRDHFCLRWLTGQPRCWVRPTLPEAYKEAADRYRRDAYANHTLYTAAYEAPMGPNHVHVWSRIWGEGSKYVGCTLCGKPRW